MSRMRTEVTYFVCIHKPRPAWLTICTPRSLGGLGVIDPVVQATAFQLKLLRLGLSLTPRIGLAMVFGLLSLYSLFAHPLSAILQSLSWATLRSLDQIRSVGYQARAAKHLPRISLEAAWVTHILPPTETLLATPSNGGFDR